MARIGVIGGGAFGTAMACVVRRAGHDVVLWALEPEVVEDINRRGRNEHFLAGVPLPAGIRATNDVGEAAAGAAFLLLAPPAQRMRAVAARLAPVLAPGTPVVSCSKGLEQASLALMPEVLAEALPGSPVAVLSGPSFAREVGHDLPCGVALASADAALARRLAPLIATPRFGVQPNDDPVGTAIGGLMKNVVAIASGVLAGRKLGENARATLVTMGLAEATRFGLAKGAKRETFDGLAGIGDMMLTANSMQSRNSSLGFALGEGKTLDEVLAGRKQVFEGAFSAQAVVKTARRLGVDMPVSFAVDALLNHGAALEASVDRLVSSFAGADLRG
ncbi:MAG: NAD(P)-dependent glycerol-3-phosphate dehydrogenase [Betaproteobacteria bacterium]|nr:NAD(P)-dependent glycerol-3-phosphate dehydrogenase [Betaproteobacteria bacterium]MDH4325108.1 NAD(P)-dependent glycerol-3-phosphate dehydrogenase [Betaproteobacteria bacterium]MDH5211081.1 NAD(P)-dependent glycerol-3-phosphate dehydrogenase [Betaproteobacteria bacterium]